METPLGFLAFWGRYPRKVARLAAERAYTKALRIASHEAIMAGVEAYRRHLPVDLQYVAYPASWLNAGRWDDSYEVEVDAPVQVESRATCRHDPICVSNEWHRVLLDRDSRKQGAA